MKACAKIRKTAAAAAVLICLVILITGLMIPASAKTVFKQIDLSSLTFTNAGTDTWKYSTDTDGSLILSQTSSSNTVAMSNVALDVGKAYTLEVKVRYNEPYSDGASDTRGGGLIFGSQSENPWESGGRCYCAMIDRGNAAKTMRVFVKGYTSTIEATTAVPADSAILANTDWHILRVTITEKGIVTFYFDGNIMGSPSDESAVYEGGQIGLIAYSIKTRVDFKDFCYTEGITTDEAVFSTGTEGTYNATVHYTYADGSKALDDVIRPTAAGQLYSIITPEIEGYVSSESIITGTMGNSDIEFTVIYKKSYTLTIHYLKSDGSVAFEDYIEKNLVSGHEYSIESIPYAHYSVDIAVVSGKIDSDDVEITVTYSPAVYSLTVNYVFPDGTEAAPAYSENVVYGENYSVTSPSVAGYAPDPAVVSGKNVKSNLTHTVTYIADSSETVETTVLSGGESAGCGSVIGAGLLLCVIPATAVLIADKKSNLLRRK